MGRKSLAQTYKEVPDKTQLLLERVRPIDQEGLLQETDEFIDEMTSTFGCHRDNLTATTLNTAKVTNSKVTNSSH